MSSGQAAAPLLVLPLPGNSRAATDLARRLGGDVAAATIRTFPDAETYVRIETEVSGADVVLVCTLDRPDGKLLPLLFCADAARDLGARSVTLVAPYLAYMRQDIRFQPGEAVTSASFAALLSRTVDALVTVDPHLHRHSSLAEIYDVPCATLHAAEVISAWIQEHVDAPLLVGPDEESAQWVGAVASSAGAPFIVLQKERTGDREVRVSVPDVEGADDRTPVLVDDIVSTARTMCETVGHLRHAGLPPPVCVGVHAVFAGDAQDALVTAGAGRIVTCDTIPHATNGIAVGGLLADGVRSVLEMLG